MTQLMNMKLNETCTQDRMAFKVTDPDPESNDRPLDLRVVRRSDAPISNLSAGHPEGVGNVKCRPAQLFSSTPSYWSDSPTESISPSPSGGGALLSPLLYLSRHLFSSTFHNLTGMSIPPTLLNDVNNASQGMLYDPYLLHHRNYSDKLPLSCHTSNDCTPVDSNTKRASSIHLDPHSTTTTNTLKNADDLPSMLCRSSSTASSAFHDSSTTTSSVNNRKRRSFQRQRPFKKFKFQESQAMVDLNTLVSDAADIVPLKNDFQPVECSGIPAVLCNPNASSGLLFDPVDKDTCNPRMKRTPDMTPQELKTKEYWEKRQRNNEAARRSRQRRRHKARGLEFYRDILLKENEAYMKIINFMKRQLATMDTKRNHSPLPQAIKLEPDSSLCGSNVVFSTWSVESLLKLIKGIRLLSDKTNQTNQEQQKQLNLSDCGASNNTDDSYSLPGDDRSSLSRS